MGIILCRNYIYLNLHEYAILSDMKRMTLCFLLLSAFLFSGCDFFRTLAGRPTSKDIENIQIAALKKEKAALQSKYDLDIINKMEKKKGYRKNFKSSITKAKL